MKTSTFFFVLFLALLATLPLHAQLDVGGEIVINIASIDVEDPPSTEDYKSRVGFGIGAVLDAMITEQLGVRVEPMYLQKGAKIEEFGEVEWKIGYLEVPIMVTYGFETAGTAEPYVMAGPSVGLLLSSKVEFEDGSEQDEKDNTAGIDFGIGVGAGVKIPQYNFTPFVEVRYLLGLANINDDAGETSVKNRGLHIVIGATVPLER